MHPRREKAAQQGSDRAKGNGLKAASATKHTPQVSIVVVARDKITKTVRPPACSRDTEPKLTVSPFTDRALPLAKRHSVRRARSSRDTNQAFHDMLPAAHTRESSERNSMR